jgi:tRNA-binding protein
LYTGKGKLTCAMLETIEWDDFATIDVRVGTVLSARPNIKARKAAYVLEIDFGDLGIKTTSAQVTEHYEPTGLVGNQVVAVVNFPSKLIAGVKSEVLVLAAMCPDNGTILLQPTKNVRNGAKIG